MVAGDHEQEPEDFDEDHALSPHSHVLQKQFQATQPTPDFCVHSPCPGRGFLGSDSRTAVARQVKTLGLCAHPSTAARPRTALPRWSGAAQTQQTHISRSASSDVAAVASRRARRRRPPTVKNSSSAPAECSADGWCRCSSPPGHDVSALARSPTARAALLVRSSAPRPVTRGPVRPRRRARRAWRATRSCATWPPTSRATDRMAVPGAWAENDRIRAEASRNLVDARAGRGRGALCPGVDRLPLRRRTEINGSTSRPPIDPVANLRSAIVAESNAARVTAAGAVAVILRFAAFYGPDSDATLDMIRLAKRRIALGAGPDAVRVVDHDRRCRRRGGGVAVGAGRALQRR